SVMSDDPIERLKQIGAIYTDFGIRYPNHYKFMFMTSQPAHEFDEQDREMHGNPERDAYAFLKWAVQQAIDAGCFRNDVQDAEMVSQILWAAVHGVISLEIAKGCDAWVEWRPVRARVDMMLDVTLRGLVKNLPQSTKDRTLASNGERK